MATKTASPPLAIERRWAAAEYRRLPEGPPDLVVEVVLPSTTRRDRSQKLRPYHQASVPWYWLVESDTLLITEYRHTPDGYLVNQTAAEGFAPALFPGLTLRLAGSFAERNLEEEPHE